MRRTRSQWHRTASPTLLHRHSRSLHHNCSPGPQATTPTFSQLRSKTISSKPTYHSASTATRRVAVESGRLVERGSACGSHAPVGGVQRHLVRSGLVDAFDDVDLPTLWPLLRGRPQTRPHLPIITSTASAVSQYRPDRKRVCTYGAAIRQVGEVEDPDGTSGVVVLGADAHRVALVLPGDDGGVVDLDDRAAVAVHEREVSRL